MCIVLTCFSFCMEAFQKVLTFCLVFLMACAVCVGLIIAIVAGVAYGYNYSLIEFISVTGNNVSVVLRRGQFYDVPDILGRSVPERLGKGSSRRSDNDTETQELGDAWLKAQDTRGYYEKLASYAPPMPEQIADTDLDLPGAIQSGDNPSNRNPLDLSDDISFRSNQAAQEMSQTNIDMNSIRRKDPFKLKSVDKPKYPSRIFQHYEPVRESTSDSGIRLHTWSKVLDVPQNVRSELDYDQYKPV